ncbi:MAG: phenylacetate--CoA ligase family protein [Clostridia bacterium]|nr:MAG: phenylacetate--CoA ligase family protein [Clostridia bacterium]
MALAPYYSVPSLKSSYWNGRVETMPREELDALHLRRVQAMIRYTYENIPMYKELYGEANTCPEDIQTLQDYIDRVPTIDKRDVVTFQQLRPPFGDTVVPGSEDYMTLRYTTSGSTGIPLQEVGFYTDPLNMWTWGWWAWGIRPKDIFYFAFPFGTFMGFWSAYFDALVFGAQVITGGGVDTKTRIKQIVELEPTVLISTPTYALHMAEVAREMGIDPAKSSIKFVSTAGEPGPAVPSIRRALEEAWGATAIDMYGISETWTAHSLHCPVRLNGIHLNENICYPLVVDENGRPVPEGEVGELVLTSYSAVLTPYVKYRTHDLVRWYKGVCDCGRTWVYLDGGVLGRTDNMIVVKGTNVYPTAVQNVLAADADVSENLEIHITSEGLGDQVQIKVEARPQVGGESYTRLGQKLEEALREKIGVRLPVEVLAPGTLPRYEMKAKRVFDHRQAR